MDKGYINYPKLLTELKEKFGKKIAPFCIPIGEKDEFKGFVNVVDMVGRVFDGKECVDTPIPADIDVSECGISVERRCRSGNRRGCRGLRVEIR